MCVDQNHVRTKQMKMLEIIVEQSVNRIASDGTLWQSINSLDSAGDGGLIVSGLTQSDGDGDRSRFVVM